MDVIADSIQVMEMCYILLVRFLFEGEVGRILYTGDFRLCEGDVSRLRQLHYSDGTVKVIDKLYLDTTFLSHQYLQFPLRHSSTSILCSLISSWLQEGADNAIYIQMPGNET
jgi:DNA cross-link repair 1C protein